MFQSPGPLLFSIAGFGIHWYGLLIGLGILFVLWWSARECKRRAIHSDSLYDMGFWVVLAGIIGARLYYVIFQWDFYGSHLLDIFAVWRGGLAIYGALIGGFLVFFIYTRWKKLSWLLYADILAPGVLFAQAIGRWGNFFNNEAFGRPTDLPWKLYMPESFRPKNFESFEYFHPTFLYESLWNLVGFIFLVLLTRKLYPRGISKKPGLIFFIYLIYYSLGRFFIENLRLDSLMIGPIRTAQLVSVLLFGIGAVSLFLMLKKRKI